MTISAPPRIMTLPPVAASRAYRPVPIGARLTRAELVAGLRTAFQRIELETVTTTTECWPEQLWDVAAVLYDVAMQFGLTAGEVEDILGDYAKRINGDTK